MDDFEGLTLSEKYEKMAGTYERNKQIRLMYRPGLGEKIANVYEITRSRVNQIVKKGKKEEEKEQLREEHLRDMDRPGYGISAGEGEK